MYNTQIQNRQELEDLEQERYLKEWSIAKQEKKNRKAKRNFKALLNSLVKNKK